jgi:hypothetical protein
MQEARADSEEARREVRSLTAGIPVAVAMGLNLMQRQRDARTAELRTVSGKSDALASECVALIAERDALVRERDALVAACNAADQRRATRKRTR